MVCNGTFIENLLEDNNKETVFIRGFNEKENPNI